MNKISKKMISTLLLIPLFFVITFCCCLEKDADASIENVSIEHHQELEKAAHHSERQHSDDQDECSCSKHLSFLSQQPIDIIPDLSFQLLAKSSLVLPAFQVVFLSPSLLYANGPPWQDYRDYATIPLFLKNSNLRI